MLTFVIARLVANYCVSSLTRIVRMVRTLLEFGAPSCRCL
jgi:hypothetical protein